VAVVLTQEQTKQIRINVHKINTKSTVNTSIPITKTATHYKTHTYTHPHITKPTHTHTHTLQNKLKQPQYKLQQTMYKIYPNEIATI